MKHVTLLFLLKDDQILLAMKKRGFGVGRWNGVGGKIEPEETQLQAAIRECQEEVGVTPASLEKVAHLTFHLPTVTGFISHTFITREWQGEPQESEEMAPEWFKLSDIPYDTMWPDDRHWLPHVLDGKKLVAEFHFDKQDNLTGQTITHVNNNHKLLRV